MSEKLIVGVERDSIAESLGINPGDKLVAINGVSVRDVLDYIFYTTDEDVVIDIKKADGHIARYRVSKEYDEDIGLVFEDGLMDKPRVCANKCVFCFVDQMPKNMRKTLYFKDDDYRLSFLHGNFITLTNVDYNDIQRIVEMRLSPLYISVHATDDDVRATLMRNPKARGIMQKLRVLVSGGISLHCQLVIARGINDGEILDKSIGDLASLHPGVLSIAVVPVGLTAHRENLMNITPWDSSSSQEIVKQVERWGKEFKKRLGTPVVYAADEFYVMAGVDVPEASYYCGFPQIENGVGLMAKFKSEFHDALKRYAHRTSRVKKVSIATGISACDFIKRLSEELMECIDVDVQVYGIKNDFFGHSVTVAGLVTGKDLIGQLKGKGLGQRLIIPDVMLKSGEKVFLDDTTVDDVKRQLNVDVVVSPVDGEEFIKNVIGEM